MKMLDRIDQGLPPLVYGDGTQSYDFIYVSECGNANICAMKSITTDSFYNVGSGTKTSVKELAEMLIKLSGSDLEVQYEPAGTTFVKNRVGSTEKAKREIGFETSVTLEDGLKKVIQWRNEIKNM